MGFEFTCIGKDTTYPLCMITNICSDGDGGWFYFGGVDGNFDDFVLSDREGCVFEKISSVSKKTVARKNMPSFSFF